MRYNNRHFLAFFITNCVKKIEPKILPFRWFEQSLQFSILILFFLSIENACAHRSYVVPLIKKQSHTQTEKDRILMTTAPFGSLNLDNSTVKHILIQWLRTLYLVNNYPSFCNGGRGSKVNCLETVTWLILQTGSYLLCLYARGSLLSSCFQSGCDSCRVSPTECLASLLPCSEWVGLGDNGLVFRMSADICDSFWVIFEG